jgi:hypothetical protein
MRSDRLVRSSRNTAIAILMLPAALAGCVSIDRYPPSTHFDAGLADTTSDITLPDAMTEQCTSCLESQCDSEWAACEADPNCKSCLLDPYAADCKQSVSRRPIRNCGCVPSTCLAECGTLCFVPAAEQQIPPDCITCTTMKCSEFISACVADSVCFGCVSDATNPRCTTNTAWNNTTECLCRTRNTCFDECGCLPPSVPALGPPR